MNQSSSVAEGMTNSAFGRPQPPLTQRTGEYWRSGEDGQLRIATCQQCQRRMHPPQPICNNCQSFDIRFDPVSGRGTVYSFTVNRYDWFPTMPAPYVIAEIELAEQPGLKVTSNVVGVEIDAVEIGMPVQVEFDQAGDTWIPVFRPC